MTEDSCMKHDVRHLELMVRYCNDIEDAMMMFGHDEEDFQNNVQYQRSCAFTVSQIGERSKRLSRDLITKFPDVEWKEIAGFRDVLSHDYENVNLPRFWNTIVFDIPKLKRKCELILKEINEAGRS